MTKEEEIQFLKDRIHWIDVHETMYELSLGLVLDREYCNKRLKELEGAECGQGIDHLFGD